MHIRNFYVLAALGLLTMLACNKTEGPIDVVVSHDYVLNIHNDFNELQARYGVFLSDESGIVKAFRWIPGEDSARLVVANADSHVFDCTVAKITVLDAPGSGVRDTAITLTTYTNLASGETINFRSNDYHITTDLNVQFTNINSFDSIIVSDGLSYLRPDISTSYTGQYRISHTGSFWLRYLVNGEGVWHFATYKNIASPDMITTIDATLLPKIMSTPKQIALPFITSWKFNVEGVVDINAKKFFPLGDMVRVPGGAVPQFNQITVVEPVQNDIFNPEPKPYTGFRVQLNGTGSSSDGNVSFQVDHLYPELPTALTLPDFDAAISPSSTNRYAGATLSGKFDVLAFTRSSSGNPSVSWEVFVAPGTGVTAYRLPELPKELSDLSSSLRTYDFGNVVHARAESYDLLQGYQQTIRYRLLNEDPLWQAKAGYVARGR